MPVKKQEAHRALELLEDYHSRLSSPQDRALRSAIERVIRIFKSRLFQALLDIQEFYELTLLDDSKSIQQKTAETLLIASKWEQDNAVKASENGTTTTNHVPKPTSNGNKRQQLQPQSPPLQLQQQQEHLENQANRIKQQEQQQQQQQLAIQQQQAAAEQEEEKPVPTILAETPSPSRYPGTRVTVV